jgi:hypothetical protein
MHPFQLRIVETYLQRVLTGLTAGLILGKSGFHTLVRRSQRHVCRIGRICGDDLVGHCVGDRLLRTRQYRLVYRHLAKKLETTRTGVGCFQQQAF